MGQMDVVNINALCHAMIPNGPKEGWVHVNLPFYLSFHMTVTFKDKNIITMK